MNNEIYELDSSIESKHWWFIVRRNLIKFHIKKFKLSSDAKIIDIGCATGSNLRLLKDMGFKNYLGLDNNTLSKKFIENKNLGEVIVGDICQNNFPDKTFDLIIATDVLEHINDDNLALKEMRRILKDNGRIIVTVPCFRSLWSKHDELVMHQRRYLQKELNLKILNNNFKIVESYYFNFLLFMPIYFYHKINKIFKVNQDSNIKFNNNFLNIIFKFIFNLDIKLARFLKPQFGVSCITVCSPK
jgi:SAM-dependent methyltransferase